MATSKQKPKTATEQEKRDSYGASSIEVIEGLDHIRKRPAMYIDSTGSHGLHHLFKEVLDNSIDEALAGFCGNIWVLMHEDGSITVKDDGRGIPVDIHPKEGRPTVEVVLTKPGAGGKFGDKAYGVSAGLHGVGISVVNACSLWLKVTAYRQGYAWTQEYDRGKPRYDLKKEFKTKKLGTDITFMYDDEVLEKGLKFNYDQVAMRLKEVSYLIPGMKLHLSAPKHKDEVFHAEDGLRDYIKHLTSSQEAHPAHREIVRLKSETMEMAFQWTNDEHEHSLSFVNCVSTPDGGTHVSGMRRALTRCLNNYATQIGKIKEKQEPLAGEDIREGLFGVIAIKVREPQFGGQTKQKLGNTEVEQEVAGYMGEALAEWLTKNDSQARKIVARVIESRDARLAARKVKQAVSKSRGLLSADNTLPGKLSDCSSEDATITEIYICEGDSAAGTGKAARDPAFQAILPLRGKIINAQKEAASKVWANKEARDIVSAVGGSITSAGKKIFVSIDKLRYGKIILAADADVDGDHITTLLLTFFYRELPELINDGHIYIAMSPLFSVQHKTRGNIYAFSTTELDELIKQGNLKQVNGEPDIKRYKGLGELNASDLRETVMDPKTRILKQVTIEDAAEAEEITNLLMGKDVAGRRKFIEDNALEVKVIE